MKFKMMKLDSIALVLYLLFFCAQPAMSQQSGQDKQAGESDYTQSREYKSGYGDVPDFGGPTSVGVELKDEDRVKEPLFRFPIIDKALKPWFDSKEYIDSKLNLDIGFDYQMLYQRVHENQPEDEAASGAFRAFGTWTLFGQDSGNEGSIVYKVEHRHLLGTELTPQELGFAAGSIIPTGTQFNEFNDVSWAMTNLYWQQRLFDKRFAFVVGNIDPTDYLDIYGLINPLTAFTNLAFLTNPTIASPNQGLGVYAGAMVTDNFYIMGGLADANGDPTEIGFETFFDDHEYFTQIEAGWVSSYERRYFDNIHLTYWHVDERDKLQTPDGWGLAFSSTWFIDDKWMPFLRYGNSSEDIALLETSVSVGLGRYFANSRDLLGFGISWGRPSAEGLRSNQYTSELFYRLQIAQNLAVTPDIQLIVDPASDPDQESVFVFGLRARLTF